MQTVSVINYKGGVGKTTVVANLAAELGWRGNKVLLIDLDPQASLTFSFLTVDVWGRRYASNKTIRNWYAAYIEQDRNLQLPSLVIRPPKVNRHITGCVDMICSHLSLINVDMELAARLSGGSLQQVRNNFLRLYSRLLDGLESPSIKDTYDYVIIDCPPNFNIVTQTAIVASDRILVPAIPDRLSTLGIDELRRHIDELILNFNGFAQQPGPPVYSAIDPSIMGIIPTMVQIYRGGPIRTQSNYISNMRATGLPVFDAFIRRNNTKFGDAPVYGVPVVLLPASGPTYVEVRAELEEMTTEFLWRV